MIRFDAPLAFLLLVLITAAILAARFLGRGKAGLRFSSTQNVRKVPASLRQRLVSLPLWLRAAALVFFTIALARPQEGKEMIRDVSKGVAIEMVLDRSGSMGLMKNIDGRPQTRLDIVKKAFEKFVSGGDGGLAGRPDDLIGMVIFARYADTLCPLTLSHGALLRFNESVQVVTDRNEDGTSIGDGVALAAARLATAEETIAKQLESGTGRYEIKSKVIILLTDGMDTGIGKRSPLDALEIAKQYGIKIYAIGITGDDWFQYVDDPLFGRRMMQAESNINTALLDRMAKETGGIYRAANDLASLTDIYKEIDALEKSEIESIRFLDYRELFVPFALIGLVLLLVEAVLAATILRRIP